MAESRFPARPALRGRSSIGCTVLRSSQTGGLEFTELTWAAKVAEGGAHEKEENH